MVNEKRLLDNLLKLIKINSPSKSEGEIADLLERDLIDLGFSVERDDAGLKAGSDTGNLIAYKKGDLTNALPIMFSAHMDTVASTEGIICNINENNTICTDGKTILGADDKAGIAAILESVKVIFENNIPHGDIEIVFSICEEIGLYGVRYLDLNRIKSKNCFVLDIGKPVGGITIAAPTHDNINVTVKGKAAHAGAEPENGINAIYAASKAIADMKIGRIDHETTANIGIMNSGCATNIVPDLCEIKGEARSLDKSKLDKQIKHMKDALLKAADETGAQMEIELIRSYNGYRLSEDDFALQIAVNAAKRAGIEPQIHETGGGSDANIFNEHGINAIPIAVGYDNPHCLNESICMDDLVRSTNIAIEIIRVASEFTDRVDK